MGDAGTDSVDPRRLGTLARGNDDETAEKEGEPSLVRCFVVDDERLARLVLRSQIERHTDFEFVGEASDVAGAVEGIRKSRPQVVFLDIGMPDQSGFDLLPSLGPEAPLIVFVTAYDQFAVRAFDVRAVDYLVKPIDPPRFDEALNRLRERLRATPTAAATVPAEEPLFVQAGKGGCWISPKDIAFIQSDRNYSSVTLADGKRVIVRQTLSAWRRKLVQPGFLQVDRTLILNLRQVRRTDFSGHSGMVYFVPGMEPLTLGRQGTTRLRQTLHSVGGNGGGALA